MASDRFADRRFLLASVLLALAVLILLGMTLRPGHNWDGDYALNVMQAINLAEGRPYTTTYFLPNPANAIHPALYPPGLPLLLSVVYGIKGLDLETMKWVGLIALSLWVVVFASIASRYLPRWMALIVTAAFAVHPFVWELKDTIYAELPFLLFCYLALLTAQRSIDEDADRGPRILFAAALVAALAAAYLTRTAAIVLFPVVAAYSIFRCRRFTRTLGAVVAALAVVLSVQHWLPADTGTYTRYFDTFSLQGVVAAVKDYGTAVGTVLQLRDNGVSPAEWGFVLLFLGAAATGYFARVVTAPSIYEVFSAAYAALLLLFPIRWEFDRYSMPLWPLLLVYGFAGARLIGQRLGSMNRWSHVLPAALLGGLLVSYGKVYSGRSTDPIDPSVTDPRSRAMFGAVRTYVPADAVVLARKPTIIGLFTERRATIWPSMSGEDEFLAYAQRVDANYVVQDILQFGEGAFDPDDPLEVFVRSHRQSLKLLFRNEWFNVYQLLPEPAASNVGPAAAAP